MSLIDGPLIDITIPETEHWEDSVAARILLILTSLLLFRMGFRVMGSIYPEYMVGAVVGVLVFAIGTQLLVFAASDFDLEVWGPRIAKGVFGLILAALLVVLARGMFARIGTDAILFSRVAVEALAAGQNPYAVDMLPAIMDWRGFRYATPRIDGSVVRQFSYPAGGVLWYLPQYLTVGETIYGIRLTNVILALATSWVVMTMLPNKLMLAGVTLFMAPRNMFFSAAGGILWPLWLFPLILGIKFWASERWLLAAFFIGLSAGTKQFAWLILPFLAIWQWKITDDWRHFADRGGKMVAVGGAVFLAMNGPFILWDFAAWVDGVLTPLSLKAPMVQQGSGATLLAFVGVVNLQTWWQSLSMGVMAAVAVTAYWLYFEELRWTAWIVPPVLLFWHSRSLMSYFNPWGVVACLAMLAVWGRLELGETTSAAAAKPSGVPADD